MPQAYSPLVRELAGGLVEAIGKDESGEGCDVPAGMLGPHLSSWLRDIAGRIDPCHDEGTAIRQLDTFCTACHERQFTTPSGATCPNGHGGDDGYLPSESTK